MPGPGEADTSIYKPLQFQNPLATMQQFQQYDMHEQALAQQRGQAFAGAGFALLERHGKNPDGMTHKDISNALGDLVAAKMLPAKEAANMMARLSRVPAGRALFDQVRQFSETTLGAVASQGLIQNRQMQLDQGPGVQFGQRGFGGTGFQPTGPMVPKALDPAGLASPVVVTNPDGSETRTTVGEAHRGAPGVHLPGSGATGGSEASKPQKEPLRVKDVGEQVQNGRPAFNGGGAGPASGPKSVQTKPSAETLTGLGSDQEYLKGLKAANEAAALAHGNVDYIRRTLQPNAIQGPWATAKLGIVRALTGAGFDQGLVESLLTDKVGQEYAAGKTEALRKAYDQLAADYLRQTFPNDRDVSDRQLQFSNNVNPNIDMTKEGANLILKHIQDVAKLKMAENLAFEAWRGSNPGKKIADFRTAWNARQRLRVFNMIKNGEYDPTE